MDNYTINSIKFYQKINNLNITGILDKCTMNNINEYIIGYTPYTIKNGDKLNDIAQKFKTEVWRILVANPTINPFILESGTNINVPFNFGIVPTNSFYTYNIMKDNIVGLSKRYPFMKYNSIGKSVDNRELYKITVGNGSNHVIYNGAHHANEWITSLLLMKWVENFLEVYSRRGYIRGYNIEKIWNSTTIDIIPMLNPDGVELVINGPDYVSTKKEQLISLNDGNENFSNWKANINGVDLNRNYDADWIEYKKLEREFGVLGPGPSLYAGDKPESEPESSALASYTRYNNSRLVLAYHTQGQVIFWNYKDLQPEISYSIGEELANVSGYKLEHEVTSEASLAGYKDWFIKDLEKPGYTIEAGKGENPLPIEQFDTIYENNEELLLLASII
jgi:g-D-glutamyl-meso-diaminopimelate peptidase